MVLSSNIFIETCLNLWERLLTSNSDFYQPILKKKKKKKKNLQDKFQPYPQEKENKRAEKKMISKLSESYVFCLVFAHAFF